MNGWYPDPGGAPGRYRYWDGRQWSTELTDDPRAAPPGSGPPTPAGGPRRRRIGVVVGVLSAVVLLVIITAVVVGNLHRSAPLLDPAPTTTVSGSDDSSPTETPTPSRSLSPSPTSSGEPTAAPLVPCPVGHPDRRESHPSDDRVYGGNLSFSAEPTYDPPAVEERLSFAYDVVQQELSVHADPDWIAQLAVGRLRAEDGFTTDARAIAESVLECTVSGNMYRPYSPTRRDVRSSSATIDGRAAWVLESEIQVEQPGLGFAGDRTIVVVARDPHQNGWGMFFGAAPIGNAQLNAVLDQAVESLRAS